MKNSSLILLICIILVPPLFGQSNPKVLVTDFIHLGTYGYDYDEIPNYLREDTVLVNQILKQTEALIKTRFTTDDVHFFEEGISEKSADMLLGNELIAKDKNIDNIDKSAADIFIVIKTYFMSNGAWAGLNGRAFKFFAVMKAENKEGKKLFKQKISIPFHSIRDEHLHGKTYIAKEQFQSFYSEALAAAFQIEKKKFEVRKIRRPSHTGFNSFLSQADTLYLKVSAKKANYQILNAKYDHVGRIDCQNRKNKKRSGFSAFADKNSLESKISLTNSLPQDVWQVKLIAKSKKVFSFLEIEGERAVVTLEKNDEELGNFVMSSYKSLLGHFKKTPYKLSYDKSTEITSIHADETLIGIAQLGSLRKEEKKKFQFYKFYYSEQLTLDAAGELLNLFLILNKTFDVIDALERNG